MYLFELLISLEPCRTLSNYNHTTCLQQVAYDDY